MTQEYKLGALRSNLNNVLVAEKVMIRSRDPLPETLDWRRFLLNVKNQGNLPTCAAQVAACIKEWQTKMSDNTNDYMSVQFVYNNRSNQTSDGMYGTNVMDILLNLGICKESTYGYGKIEPPTFIPKNAFTEATNYKIKSYASVNSIDGLKQSLYQNGPCYISFPVYNYDNEFWIKKNNEEFKGGHAVTVVGYDKIGFILRNSWGNSWNNNGYTIYPYNQWSNHWEILTCINIKPPLPNPDPIPEDNQCCKDGCSKPCNIL